MGSETEIFGALAQAAMIVGGFTIVMLFFFITGTMFWVRKKVQGKVLCMFIEPNLQVTDELITVGTDGKILSKHADKDEAYLVLHERTFWSHWPKGFPRWMQEPIPTLIFNRNQAEPIDPKESKSITTAKTLGYLTDEGMLRATWKDANESVGITGKNPLLQPIVILGAVLLVAIGIVGFIAFQVSTELQELDELVRSQVR